MCLDARRLVWLSNEDTQKGYGVDFIALTMHAISRDIEAYPEPCIYTQVHLSRLFFYQGLLTVLQSDQLFSGVLLD